VVSPLRLGVVSYLNAVPTVQGLDSDPRFEIVRDVPSRIAARLHAGEIDLGLIPSIEYAEGDYAIVPGIAIASRGPVRSVMLLHRRPIEGIRRVAVDTSSRTSAALVRVLLRDRLGRDPEYAPMPPDVPAMLNSADAALVIGDPALYYDGEAARLDLGAEWTERTGRPFVYAFWAGHACSRPWPRGWPRWARSRRPIMDIRTAPPSTKRTCAGTSRTRWGRRSWAGSASSTRAPTGAG
jgi:predicted solute-binding protein